MSFAVHGVRRYAVTCEHEYWCAFLKIISYKMENQLKMNIFAVIAQSEESPPVYYYCIYWAGNASAQYEYSHIWLRYFFSLLRSYEPSIVAVRQEWMSFQVLKCSVDATNIVAVAAF